MKRSFIIVLVLMGCTKEQPETQAETTITPAEGLMGVVQLKPADVVVAFYSTVTGVPETNATIVKEVLVTRDFLPLAGKPADLSAMAQRAYVSLASAYCLQAVERQIALPAQGILFVGIDFTKNQAAFTSAQREALIDRIALSAWGRSVTAEEKAELLAALKDWEATPDSSAELKKLVTLLCTGMLTTADAIRM